MLFKARLVHAAIRKALRTMAVLSALASTPAWATVTIPEALSSGQQLGADSENQTAGSLAGMQSGVSTTTGATAGGTNATTGVSGTQAVGNPADGEDAESGATASGNYNFTLSCATNNQQNPISPGDYELFAANCTYSGSGASSAVSGMTLYSCPASINGGNCAEGSPNWQAVGIGPGQTVQIAKGVNVTLANCPSDGSGSCTGNVAVTNSTMHTSANLNNDATDDVTSGGSGVDTMLGNTYNSGNYQTAIQTGNSSYQLNSCTQQIKGGLNGNGIVYTCNGQQNADFNATNCTSTKQCVKWATQTESYTRSCNEDIPLTENVCTTNTPTQNCTITANQAQYNCSDTYWATVAWTTSTVASCSPGQQVESFGVQNGGGSFGSVTLQCSGNGGYIVFNVGNLSMASGTVNVPINGSTYDSTGHCGWTLSTSVSGNTLTASAVIGGDCASSDASGSGTTTWPEVQTINVPYISGQGWSNGCAIYQGAN